VALLSNVFGDLLDDPRDFGMMKFWQGHGHVSRKSVGHDTSINGSVR
jgi:hypothetical protein